MPLKIMFSEEQLYIAKPRSSVQFYTILYRVFDHPKILRAISKKVGEQKEMDPTVNVLCYSIGCCRHIVHQI